MTGFEILVLIMVIAIVVAAIGAIVEYLDPYSTPAFAVLAVAVMVIFATGIMLLVTTTGRATGKTECRKYAEQNNMETEFRDFGLFNYGCYTKTDKDTWVPIENVQLVIKVDK